MAEVKAQYKTAGGSIVQEGDLVFSHYTMRKGIIGRAHGSPAHPSSFDGWFDYMDPETGYRRDMLNGERICTLAEARRYGHLKEGE